MRHLVAQRAKRRGELVVELAEQGLERDAGLESGLAGPAGVEVELRAQEQLLADEQRVSAAEDRGEPLLRSERLAALSLRRSLGQLDRAPEAAVGDLLALAVAQAHDEGVVGADVARVRVAAAARWLRSTKLSSRAAAATTASLSPAAVSSQASASSAES